MGEILGITKSLVFPWMGHFVVGFPLSSRTFERDVQFLIFDIPSLVIIGGLCYIENVVLDSIVGTLYVIMWWCIVRKFSSNMILQSTCPGVGV
jgi:hypothetical protein